MAARYRLTNSPTGNTWYDTVTGESFTVSDTLAYQAYKQWSQQAGNTPDPAPTTPASSPFTQEMQALVTKGRTAIASATLATPNERALGNALTAALDAIAKLSGVNSNA